VAVRADEGRNAARTSGGSARESAALPSSEDVPATQRSGPSGLFEAAFDNAPVGMALLDLDGRWFRVNPALSRMLGYSAVELTGRACPDLTHPDDVLADDVAVRQLKSGEQTVTLDKRYRHRDGHVVWVRRSTSLVRDEDGFPEYVVAAYEDIGERRQQDARLSYLALHDALTGLANRALLDDRLMQAIAQRDRDGGAVAVLFCDVDGLKAVNDEHGHAFGDELLVTVARRLTSQVRTADTVARVGGDEFVVVSNLRVPSDAEAMSRRVAAALDTRLEAPDGTHVPVRVSVGSAVAIDHTVDAATLLRSADQAMYAAKRLRGWSAMRPIAGD
jgi:diguanylate cyclase (GGDEF)-like protein/PAS domain S-box-containing protein